MDLKRSLKSIKEVSHTVYKELPPLNEITNVKDQAFHCTKDFPSSTLIPLIIIKISLPRSKIGAKISETRRIQSFIRRRADHNITNASKFHQCFKSDYQIHIVTEVLCQRESSESHEVDINEAEHAEHVFQLNFTDRTARRERSKERLVSIFHANISSRYWRLSV